MDAALQTLEAYEGMLSGELRNHGTTAGLDPSGAAGSASTSTVIENSDGVIFVLLKLDNPNTDHLETVSLSKTQPGSTPEDLRPESALSSLNSGEVSYINFLTGVNETISSAELNEKVRNFALDVFEQVDPS